MILAGIDEAGLGPTLGPLVTARAALLVPDDWGPDAPWEKLAAVCSRDAGRGEARVAVADSKVLYRRGGLPALELAVGVFSRLAGSASPALDGGDGALPRHPCYSGGLAPFPAANPPERIAAAAAALGPELEKAGAAALALRPQALFEPEMNSLFAAGLNKNQVLLRETGRHIRALVDEYPDRPLLVVVDKQGGRDDYLPFLTGLFPGSWAETLEAGRAISRYRLRRAGAGAEIRFQAKADAVSFPTALASLAAKYARERAMAELNGWFGARVPGLRATAGYPVDAARWLGEVRPGGTGLEVELTVRLR